MTDFLTLGFVVVVGLVVLNVVLEIGVRALRKRTDMGD